MTLYDLLEQIENDPLGIAFADVIAVIDANYVFTPTAFRNGETQNAAGENNGSCKIFAFAKLHELSEAKTLALFGDYYRIDVLKNPEGTDHQNIRNFIRKGWAGVAFEGEVLTAKT